MRNLVDEFFNVKKDKTSFKEKLRDFIIDHYFNIDINNSNPTIIFKFYHNKDNLVTTVSCIEERLIFYQKNNILVLVTSGEKSLEFSRLDIDLNEMSHFDIELYDQNDEVEKINRITCHEFLNNEEVIVSYLMDIQETVKKALDRYNFSFTSVSHSYEAF